MKDEVFLFGGHMKRMSVLLLLAGALLSTVASANSGFKNERGTIWISGSGIVSKGSQLVFCNGFMSPPGGSLGSLSFVAGALLSGSLQAGGTFSADGSSLTVTGWCKKKDEPRGVIFVGTFDGPILWTLVSQTGQKLTFILSGSIRGTNRRGRRVNGITTQVIVTTVDQLAQGIGHIEEGVVEFGT